MPKTRAAVDVRSATVVKQLVIERTLKSSPERVFDAFTDPDQLTKWWWPTGFACPAAEVDLRVGGKYVQARDGMAGLDPCRGPVLPLHGG